MRDRVKSGIAAARSKRKSPGRPRVNVDGAGIAILRDSGASWTVITRQLGLGAGDYYSCPKILVRDARK